MKQTNYDKKLLELLACRFVPFEIVNSQEFKNFVSELDKTINLKHSTTYSRQMKDFSADILEDVKKAVDEFCDASAAITTDLWTSRARDSYISITLHFVDKMFRLHRWTLVHCAVYNSTVKCITMQFWQYHACSVV